MHRVSVVPASASRVAVSTSEARRRRISSVVAARSRRGLLAAVTELRDITRVAWHPAGQLAHAYTTAVHGRGEGFCEIHRYTFFALTACWPVLAAASQHFSTE